MTRTTKRRAGRANDFTPEQNHELRALLHRLKDQRDLSQVEIGRKLGVAQQNIARLLSDDTAGFSYGSATRLCHQLGYDGVDTFFRAKGVALRRSA